MTIKKYGYNVRSVIVNLDTSNPKYKGDNGSIHIYYATLKDDQNPQTENQ